MYGKWILIKNTYFNRLINDLFIVGCKCLLCSKKMCFIPRNLKLIIHQNLFFYIYIYIHLSDLNLWTGLPLYTWPNSTFNFVCIKYNVYTYNILYIYIFLQAYQGLMKNPFMDFRSCLVQDSSGP